MVLPTVTGAPLFSKPANPASMRLDSLLILTRQYYWQIKAAQVNNHTYYKKLVVKKNICPGV